MFLFLANKEVTRAAQSSESQSRSTEFCQSSKDAEMLSILKMVEDPIYAAWHLHILLYGEDKKRVMIYLFTDLESSLKSITSSKQIEWKILRLTVVDLKKRLAEEDILSYASLPTEKMWADL